MDRSQRLKNWSDVIHFSGLGEVSSRSGMNENNV